MAAAAFAQGKATVQLLEVKLLNPDPARRRIAAIALALRHPIYGVRYGMKP